MLGTPPAFVLSQDQTLKNLYLKLFPELKINFLNNSLLAFHYSRIFVGCFFRLRLNNPLLSKVLFSSCVIQFTRYSRSFCVHIHPATNFYMLAHLFPFVKNFFQILTKFFVRRPRGQLAYSTIQSSLCQGIFTYLAIFFICFLLIDDRLWRKDCC